MQHCRAHTSDIAQDYKQDLILPDGRNVSEITVVISIVSSFVLVTYMLCHVALRICNRIVI